MPSARQITVGGVPIGGGAPVAVQTMTKTETANLQATMDQIRRVADAGADIVRVAVPRDKDVDALRTIVVESPIPVIADIHFNHTLALKAIDAGAHCIRLNPGNIGGREKVAEVAARATAAGVPMRIGVNSGSLPRHLHELERLVRGYPAADAEQYPGHDPLGFRPRAALRQALARALRGREAFARPGLRGACGRRGRAEKQRAEEDEREQRVKSAFSRRGTFSDLHLFEVFRCA